jgi:hypothetical protein
MIAEWRKGCSCMIGGDPSTCGACTTALIEALEQRLTLQQRGISEAVKILRAVAEPVGPMHAYWDVITDLGEPAGFIEFAEQSGGVRFREETVTIKTHWDLVGGIHQLVRTPTDIMQARVLRTMESQARDALTTLGWTPPGAQVIVLTPEEIQSGHDRVRWAEGLIRQLPEDHDGRNSWLLNYGKENPL